MCTLSLLSLTLGPNPLKCTTEGLAQGSRAGWEKVPSDPLSYKAQACYLQNSELSFRVQPSFELGLFVFSKEENVAPLNGPKKVLPWLLRTEKASTAHSWHGSIRKQQCKFAQRIQLYPGHTGPREGYKCLDIWKDSCHYRQPWEQKKKNDTDKGWQLIIHHHHSHSLPKRSLFLQPV